MSQSSGAPDYRESLHRYVVETAEAVIEGVLGPVEAARRFVGIAAELDALDEAAFGFFLGLDSESHQYPLGEARGQWSEKALRREDRALREFEARMSDEAVRHCKELLAKYSSRA